jgi:hypothetical protein
VVPALPFLGGIVFAGIMIGARNYSHLRVRLAHLLALWFAGMFVLIVLLAHFASPDTKNPGVALALVQALEGSVRFLVGMVLGWYLCDFLFFLSLSSLRDRRRWVLDRAEGSRVRV